MMMLPPPRPLYRIALLLALVLIGACEKSSEPMAKPILVGTNTWPGYAPGYIARDKGLYGSDLIQLQVYESATEVMPYRGQLLALDGVEIFNSKQLPNEIIDVLVIRAEYAEANPQTLRALIKGWLDAATLIKTAPETVAQDLAWYLKIPITEVEAAFEGLTIPDARQNHDMLGGREPTLMRTNSKIMEFMERTNKKKIRQLSMEIYTDRFVPESE